MLYIKEKLSDKQSKMLRNQYDAKLIDSIELEGYELYLLKFLSGLMDNVYDTTRYTLGLQKSGRDFTDPNQQFEIIPFESLPKSIVPKIINKVKEWIDKYGEIIVDSYNPKRVDQYKKLFNRFGIGYREVEKNFAGNSHKYLVLGKL